MEEQELIESTKPKKNKVTTILSNVLFGVVMVILVVFLGYSIGSVTQNKVPSFFGKSYVRILTGSMNASGFKEGDVVMIKKVKLSEIKVGNIIAFYWGPTHSAPSFATNPALNDMETGQSSFDVSIVFHQVAEVRVDTRGNLWVKTYGTSNMNAAGEPSYDGWTKGDRIVGVYEESIFAGVIQFISSTTGIIAIVIVPSCIVLFILLMRIIDILDKMSQEKKKNKQENLDKINEINGVGGEDGEDEKQENPEGENIEQQSQEQSEEVETEDVATEEVVESEEQTVAKEQPVQQQEVQEQPEVEQIQEQVVEEQPVEQPAKKSRKSKKSEQVVEQIQEETIPETEQEAEEVVESEDDGETKQEQKPKKQRKILEKEERDQISQQVDELVKKSKTRKIKKILKICWQKIKNIV